MSTVYLYLARSRKLLSGAGESCEDGCGGGADVGTQGQRVRPVKTDHTNTCRGHRSHRLENDACEKFILSNTEIYREGRGKLSHV